MRLLHLTDLHGRRSWFGWLHWVAAQYDLVCITGDLIEQERDVPFVRRAILRLKVPLAVCSGNHDLGLEWLQPLRPSDLWVDCGTFRFGGVAFRCLPWGEPIPSGVCDDVWLIHTPPSGTAAARTQHGVDHGDVEFREVCLAGSGPKIALCGHIHDPIAWNSVLGRTRVLNPGFAGTAARPSFTVLDLHSGTARHHATSRASASVIQLP